MRIVTKKKKKIDIFLDSFKDSFFIFLSVFNKYYLNNGVVSTK